MADAQKYLVRDKQGQVYGPADAAMLRQWVEEGRIIPGMHVAPRETREWVEVSGHPELVEAIARQNAARHAAEGQLQQGAAGEDLRSWDEPLDATEVVLGEVVDEPHERGGGTMSDFPEAEPAYRPTVEASRPAAPMPAGFPESGRQAPTVSQGASHLPYETPLHPRLPRQNGLGIASLCLGIGGLVVSCGMCGCLFLMPLSLLLALSAIVTGSVAMWQINSNPAAYLGKGPAMAGTVMGVVTLLLFGVGAILAIVTHIR